MSGRQRAMLLRPAMVPLLCGLPVWAGLACFIAGPRLHHPVLVEIDFWLFMPLVALGSFAVVGGTALVVALNPDRSRR